MNSLNKYLILLSLTFLISNCNSFEKNENKNKKDDSTESQLITKDSIKITKPEIERNKEITEITEFDEFYGRKISYYLSHSEIPLVCKEIFLKKRKVSDDNEVLALMDSLFTKNNETRPFYFLTLTKTMEKADGAYAEPLGIMGKQFVENHTKEFLDYFIYEPILTNKDFNEWALTVIGEIKIIAENKERKEFETLKSKMTDNCKDCNVKQREKLKEFLNLIENHSP